MKRSEMTCERCINSFLGASDDEERFCNRTPQLMLEATPIDNPAESWCSKGKWAEADERCGVVLREWGDWETWEEYTENWPKCEEEVQVGDEDDGNCD